MATIPSYNFGFKTNYLRGGDRHLRISGPEDSEAGLTASLDLDGPRLKTVRRAR
jgi:hypothetical protein